MKKEFVEIPRVKGQAIEIGMGASGTYYSDLTPYEVVRVISDKTIEIRELDIEITGGDWIVSYEEEYSQTHKERGQMGA